MDSHQANLQPNLLLRNSQLCFNPTPTFLGVIFNRTLSFSKHVSLLKATFFPCLKTLHCISASSWGPSNESLSLLCKAVHRPLLTYASPGWFPFLSDTNITKLECLHRAASHVHHWLPLVLPSPHQGFFTSPTSHSDSFHSFIL